MCWDLSKMFCKCFEKLSRNYTRMVDYVSWLSVLSVTQIDWVNITGFIQPEDGGGGEAVAGVVRQLQYPAYYYENTTAVKMELFFRHRSGLWRDQGRAKISNSKNSQWLKLWLKSQVQVWACIWEKWQNVSFSRVFMFPIGK